VIARRPTGRRLTEPADATEPIEEVVRPVMEQHEFVYPKVTPVPRVAHTAPEPTAGHSVSPNGRRALVEASLLVRPPDRKRG
jgi:hypothetical protein